MGQWSMPWDLEPQFMHGPTFYHLLRMGFQMPAPSSSGHLALPSLPLPTLAQ